MTHSLFLLFLLIGLVGFLSWMKQQALFKSLFRFLPLPFWCYILPALGTTFGWLPGHNPLYAWLSQFLLPVALVLMLIGTDLKSLARLGTSATLLMLAGSLGTICGGLASFILYERYLPPGSCAGIGALCASWIGGSANLLAVKEALHVSDAIVGPLILVDAMVAYSWMALLIWASSLQERWSRFVWRGVPALGDPPEHRSRNPSEVPLTRAVSRALPNREIRRGTMPAWSTERARSGRPIAGFVSPRAAWLTIGILVSVLVTGMARGAGGYLPTLGGMLSPATWTILLVTTTALGLSLTPLRQLGDTGGSTLGTFALYLLLTSIGARANFQAILQTPVFLALGMTWIAIHGIFLLVAGYFLKAPLGLIATASQANIGGPISAPIVGATFSPQLASVGLLMAILGNILGTYLGFLTGLAACALVKPM